MTAADQHLQDMLQMGRDHIDTVVEGTLISIVLDESGSMVPVRTETIDGFNRLIEEQKKEPGKAWVSLTLFDTTVTQVYTGIPIDQVPALTATYSPKGGTALLDAQGIAIESTEKHLAQLPDDQRPAKVIFVTMTDGGENSSKDYTAEDIKRLISRKQEADDWDFAYTGANQDSFAVAQSLGINSTFTVDYASTAAGTSGTFDTMSASIAQYRGLHTDSAAWKQRRDRDFWHQHDRPSPDTPEGEEEGSSR